MVNYFIFSSRKLTSLYYLDPFLKFFYFYIVYTQMTPQINHKVSFFIHLYIPLTSKNKKRPQILRQSSQGQKPHIPQ